MGIGRICLLISSLNKLKIQIHFKLLTIVVIFAKIDLAKKSFRNDRKPDILVDSSSTVRFRKPIHEIREEY